MAKVLLVEDQPEILDVYTEFLTADGFEVIVSKTSHDALATAPEVRPDVILADVLMPGLDGFALCRRLKGDPRTANIPVILLSPARRADREQAARSAQAVDDYFLEPSSRPLLAKKIHAVLKQRSSGAERELLGGRDLLLDLEARTVRVKAREVRLTRKEFDLLALFLRMAGRVLTIERLLRDVWSYDVSNYSNPRTVQSHIFSLRRKIGPAAARRIVSLPGIGYRFD